MAGSHIATGLGQGCQNFGVKRNWGGCFELCHSDLRRHHLIASCGVNHCGPVAFGFHHSVFNGGDGRIVRLVFGEIRRIMDRGDVSVGGYNQLLHASWANQGNLGWLHLKGCHWQFSRESRGGRKNNRQQAEETIHEKPFKEADSDSCFMNGQRSNLAELHADSATSCSLARGIPRDSLPHFSLSSTEN